MFRRTHVPVFCLILAAASLWPQPAGAADWPMWRCNAHRGAATPHGLAPKLHLQWVREYPRLETAWVDQPRLRFDKAYSPVVLGRRMYVGSSHNDSVTALDTRTGAELWRFFADGPVRFAPVAWQSRLYVCSDDGYLYCLDAATGRLFWKFRGGPSDRKILASDRLASTWPVRGAPVLADGKLYFAAGVWPFMGIFIYCLDARTGRVVWRNDHTGSMYTLRPHHSPAFSGLAPQGYLAVVGDDLLVPNGRTTVARLDRKTGRLIYHDATGSGTYHLAATKRFYFNVGVPYETETGRRLLGIRTGYGMALTDRTMYLSGLYSARAYDLSGAKVGQVEGRRGRKYYYLRAERKWRIALPTQILSMIQAGPRLYIGGPQTVAAVDIPAKKGARPRVRWVGGVDGRVVDLLAADGRLFAVTLGGSIYCFGPDAVTPRRYPLRTTPPARPAGAGADRAKEILAATKVRAGYCVAMGAGSGRLIEHLARQSDLHIIAIEPDAKKVDALRRKLDALGLYGRRVVVLQGDPATYPLPPYLASLVVLDDAVAAGLRVGGALLRQVVRVLRPYGGAACFRAAGDTGPLVRSLRRGAHLGATLRTTGNYHLLVREGPLPGSADWTHQYADAANTAASGDTLVKAPLGVLWFGGPSNEDILPRHGHGPSPQVVGGRLFIEGPNVLRAVDVYTGRVLWQRSLPGVGSKYDSTLHQPGANAFGSNYVSLPDGIYVIHGTRCLRLDPATGRTLSTFTLPRIPGQKSDPEWGFLSVSGRVMVAGADPITVSPTFAERNVGRRALGAFLDGTSSERLVALDRHTGRVLWQYTARFGVIHNTIIFGGGKVFCIDRPRVPRGLLPEDERGKPRAVPGSRLLAFDAHTGRLAWSKQKGVFGTWLAYSKQHDVLIEAGRASRDMLWDEPDSRMAAFRGKDGSLLWDRPNRYNGPCMLLGDTIITQRKAYDLLTGRRKMRRHPLTGQLVPWGYSRNYGCGTARASRFLLTFRSAAAGFVDLARDGGTANLGGFKSGCTANLLVADGVLNAPDYTRTCSCGYPNQTSLALVHMPENEVWSFNADLPWDGAPIRRLGVNLGAPGDRRADDGTLWLEYPYVGGPTPEIPITMVPAPAPQQDTAKEPGRFVRHSSRIRGKNLRWVAASGIRGIRRLVIPLALPTRTVEGPDGKPVVVPRPLRERTYTVRLYFCEPEAKRPGQRVFDVHLQGRSVLAKFDVVREAGGPDRPVVKEFRRVRVKDNLTIDLSPSNKGSKPVLNGVEILAEGW